MYLKGFGVRFKPMIALKAFKWTAKQNDPNVWYQLGLMSETGVAQKIDLDSPRIYLRKSSKSQEARKPISL
ncbi:hypothetical protein [Candidatus Coxiella mudrowiae]|uniref:hypothetical protein n=1 Tax=Candidatus Coxiella mudrowiae TaxID=2054173 RepID=UPI001F19F5BC|nr:hypothetical protein [Candidatus Coxiella mudrowiae]